MVELRRIPPDAKVQFDCPELRAVPGGYFRMSEQTREPVFAYAYAAHEATLTLDGVKSHFRIADDSPDDRMLGLVARGLAYVRRLEIGDAVPSELTTGAASWDAEERHRRLASQRVMRQITLWFSRAGQPSDVVLGDLVAAVEGRTRVAEVFAWVSAQLGLGAKGGVEVTERIAYLADVLSHVEVLRERLQSVQLMRAKVQAFRKLYGGDHSRLDVVDPVVRLLDLAWSDLCARFAPADIEADDILDVLRDVQAHGETVRRSRDKLHAALLDWTDILQAWREAEIERSHVSANLLRRTYGFLAPRYMASQRWKLTWQYSGEAARSLSATE